MFMSLLAPPLGANATSCTTRSWLCTGLSPPQCTTSSPSSGLTSSEAHPGPRRSGARATSAPLYHSAVPGCCSRSRPSLGRAKHQRVRVRDGDAAPCDTWLPPAPAPAATPGSQPSERPTLAGKAQSGRAPTAMQWRRRPCWTLALKKARTGVPAAKQEEAEEEEEEPPRPTGALAEQGKRPPPPARCRFAECTRSRSCAHCRLWLAPAKSPNEVHQGAGVPKLGLDVREG
ncbi:unnamed protein product, partial [Prorocentrum cordatum]